MVYFASVFYEYDHCEHIGVFSTTALAIAAIDAWLERWPHVKSSGYNAEVVGFTLDAADSDAQPTVMFGRRSEDDA